MFTLNQQVYKSFDSIYNMDYFKEIRILNLKPVKKQPLNDDIQWFSNCLGMFNKRDKEKSCFRIFIHLLKEGGSLSSEQLAQRSNLSRATVIHHASRLMDSGLVIRKENSYILRFNNLEDLTREIEKDVYSTFKRLREVSKKIDEELKE